MVQRRCLAPARLATTDVNTTMVVVNIMDDGGWQPPTIWSIVSLMLLRLIFILIALVLTAPDYARGCHSPVAKPAAVAMTGHHSAPKQHHDAPNAASEMCLGCIPPSSWRGPSVVASIALPQMPRAILIQPFVAGLSAPPALPPPRRG